MEVHQMFAWGKAHWQKLASNPLVRSQWFSDALEIIEILLRDTLVYQATHSGRRLINSDLEERIRQYDVLNAEAIAKLQEERLSEAREKSRDQCFSTTKSGEHHASHPWSASKWLCILRRSGSLVEDEKPA